MDDFNLYNFPIDGNSLLRERVTRGLFRSEYAHSRPISPTHQRTDVLGQERVVNGVPQVTTHTQNTSAASSDQLVCVLRTRHVALRMATHIWLNYLRIEMMASTVSCLGLVRAPRVVRWEVRNLMHMQLEWRVTYFQFR